MAGIFKAYDIRGTVPDQIDERTALLIGRATALFLKARRMVVGRDMRQSGVGLSRALIEGIRSTGCDVVDVGVVSTPMQYFACGHLGGDGGVQVTASHNPAAYNGFKISGQGVVPVGGDSGLAEIEAMVRAGVEAPTGVAPGSLGTATVFEAYTRKITGMLHFGPRRLRVAIDCGNGMGGFEVEHVVKHLPIDFVGIFLEPDGTFPNHEANPLNPKNMRDLQAAVLREKCDLGIAFDGDADRACFCDEKGALIGNDLVTALLARELVPREPGASVVYDLRSSRVVPQTVSALGGNPIRERVGHAFMKRTLRKAGGPYGGELSGHFYFRDLWYTDSGVYAAGLVLTQLSRSDRPFSDHLKDLRKYPTTGEVNFEVEDKDGLIEKIAATFRDARQDRLDGITIEYPTWWCNVRKSNTEPLLRLVMEADDAATYERAKEQLMSILGTPSEH
ncbi:MAG: phosphomannomutase/phosphoglucomutase [Planctomycetes bacterium]|nr:phosphomannomutase/phosphoglucomutase [Planctomycetota bacterium]